jgi:hypothetical protein
MENKHGMVSILCVETLLTEVRQYRYIYTCLCGLRYYVKYYSFRDGYSLWELNECSYEVRGTKACIWSVVEHTAMMETRPSGFGYLESRMNGVFSGYAYRRLI